MAAARRRVFVEKVLKRLFAGAPGAEEQGAPPAHQEAPESAEPGPEAEAEPGRAWGARPPGGGAPRPGVRAAGGPSQALARRRPYTVSLPPEGYLPAPLAPPCGPDARSPSGSSSSSSEEEDQDPHDQPKRRIRKHKSKKKFKNPHNVHVEQAELEKQQSLLQKELQPQHTDGPTISKNKKRKLKKKQQIKRKKAAGLLTKPSPGLDFTYQPEACGQEPAPQGEEAGEAGDLAGAPGASPPAQSLLSFLKSTQETYFYDGVSDPAVSMETAEGLLRHLETHGLAPSDLRLLDHMQTLLLSGDAAGLRGALEAFPGRCELPPDHARVISALFSYWITHVLPEKQQ